MYDMLNATTLELVVKEHQNRLAEEVRRSRLPKPAKPVGLRLWERLFVRIGDLLISTGERLHERYAPAACSCPEVCQSTVKAQRVG